MLKRTLLILVWALPATSCFPAAETGDGDAGAMESPCDHNDSSDAYACSCQALASGWCLEYHNDVGWLQAGACAELGGTELAEDCPTENVAGRCVEIDDCHSPAEFFYEDYAGGYKDIDTLQAAEARCDGCYEWMP